MSSAGPGRWERVAGGQGSSLRSKNSRHKGRECGGVVCPRTVRIPEWLEHRVQGGSVARGRLGKVVSGQTTEAVVWD